MDIPHPADKTFAKVLSIKQAVASSVFTTTARVRDGLLRPTSDDGFERVKRAIAEAQAETGSGDSVVDLFS